MKKFFIAVLIAFVHQAAQAQCPNTYRVSGGGTLCGSPVTLNLSGSDTGTTYRLYSAAGVIGTPLRGTGSPLSWSVSSVPGFGFNYLFVEAFNATCYRHMADTGYVYNGIPSGISSYAPCIGGSTLFYDSSIGLTGTWSSSNIAIVSVSSGGIGYGVSRGTATITFSTGGTCGSHTTTRTIYVDSSAPAVTVNGPDTVCRYSNIRYSTTSGYYPTWSSTPSSVATIEASTGILHAVGAGTVTITCSVITPCGTTTGTRRVVVSSSAASATITAPFGLQMGDTAQLSVAGATGGTWEVATYGSNISATGLFVPGYGPSTTVKYNYRASCGAASVQREIAIASYNDIMGDSFFVTRSVDCAGLSAVSYTGNYRPGMYLKTTYGDGTSDISSFGTYAGSLGFDSIDHDYTATGVYTVKHVLYTSSRRIDSVTYSLPFTFCNTVNLQFFPDLNGNCRLDPATEHGVSAPFSVAIDSNGYALDTVSVLSGLYYRTFGPAGTVYHYRVISPNISVSCLSGGYVSDTVSYSNLSRSIQVALVCSGGTRDYFVSGSGASGRSGGYGYLTAGTTSCTSDTGSLTLHFDSHFRFRSANVMPTSTTATSATWHIDSLFFARNSVITYVVDTATSGGPRLRDTVRTSVSLLPRAGDTDTTNNAFTRLDTVRASMDPNAITVSPAGDILNGTMLHYAIHFENDGNAPAANIHVMDTLSANVDINSLRIESASANMNVSYTQYGSRTVVKFDFPGIYLADSSHHNECTGFVTYKVKAARGLSDGTTISNRAGIYFDGNSVVGTNSVTNKIVVPSVLITAADSSICTGDTVRLRATVRTLPNSHYQWYQNSIPVGSDAPTFNTWSVATGDVFRCTLTTIQDETITTSSAPLTISVATLPFAGIISARTALCTGDSITLTTSGSGGTWSVVGGHSTILGSRLTAVSAGNDTITYAVSNSCGYNFATLPVVINNTVTPSVSISSFPAGGGVCEGDSVTFVATAINGGASPVFHWKRYGVELGTGILFAYSPALGDIITCDLVSSAQCASPATVTSSGITMTVYPIVTPTVTIDASVDSITVPGQRVNFNAYITYGGSLPTYQWYVNGAMIPGANSRNFTYHVIADDTIYCVITSNAPCANRLTDTSGRIVLHGIPDPSAVGQWATASGNISLFPSPNSGQFTISGTTTGNTGTYQIVDMPGRVLASGSLAVENNQFAETINLTDIAPGYYLVHLVTGNTTSYLRFVVTK